MSQWTSLTQWFLIDLPNQGASDFKTLMETSKLPFKGCANLSSHWHEIASWVQPTFPGYYDCKDLFIWLPKFSHGILQRCWLPFLCSCGGAGSFVRLSGEGRGFLESESSSLRQLVICTWRWCHLLGPSAALVISQSLELFCVLELAQCASPIPSLTPCGDFLKGSNWEVEADK